ncbi:MAG: hypothetical protein ACK4FR_14235, partial [Tabrizicola sp.]
LMADIGLEDGETPGLGWVHGIVEALVPAPGLPVPEFMARLEAEVETRSNRLMAEAGFRA